MAQHHLGEYGRVVFFTGAGVSAESGVPTYRGKGGIWDTYDWQQVACQAAFDADPDRVLDFHEIRRGQVANCAPNAAHQHIAAWQQRHAGITLITQNTDGLHARAGSDKVIELHGSLWRLRCPHHGRFDDYSEGSFLRRKCPQCDTMLRPDITWFHDPIDQSAFSAAAEAVAGAELFIAVGTSAVVWPAAGFIDTAARFGARMIEINPDATVASERFDEHVRDSASAALPHCFPLPSAIDQRQPGKR